MPDLSISLFGRLTVHLDARPLKAFRTKSVTALLVVLASETGETGALQREWLIELLWPGQPAGAGRKNLRQSLYELRRAIPEVRYRVFPVGAGADSPQPFVLADRQTIQLNSECDYQVDTIDFETLLAQGDVAALRQAVDLYKGPFLADFYMPDSSAFEDWAAAKRALYQRLALEALEKLAQHDLRQGAYEQAAGFARRQLALDSLREKALQQLMVALALNGQRSEALAQYEESRRELQQELGVDPEPATLAVYERISSGEIYPAGDEVLADLLAGETPPLPALDSAVAAADEPEQEKALAHNLPAEPTPFVGREREVSEVTGQLLDPACRLLTILGPGGCGKSRLAVQAGQRLLANEPESFPDGIWYASLTKAAGADMLVTALADGLPFKSFDLTSDLRSQLLAYLAQRRLLLVLDNMEYAQAPDGLQLIAEVLDRAPGVSILACSRSRLNLHAEQLFRLAGLKTPDTPAGGDDSLSLQEVLSYSAPLLFLNSARRVRPDFEVTAGNVASVLAICRQLQGMPLAVELAASWVEVMAPSEVAAEVRRCLDFLESDWVDVPERQRSLRTIFQASWRLLNAQERAAFLRLSVFRGGFSPEAARQVADTNLRTLQGLLNKSWLQREKDGRYLAHEMLRQYAYQRLTEDDVAYVSAHNRHGDYFSSLANEQGELLKGPQQLEATARIERDLKNIVVAWEWFTERDRYKILVDQMLPGLFLYFAARSLGQQLVSLVDLTYCRLTSGETPADPAWQVILLTAQAAFPSEFLITRYFVLDPFLPFKQDQIEKAHSIASEHDLEDQLGIWSLILAMLYGWSFDRLGAIAWLRRLVTGHRVQHDRWLLAFTLENLGGLLLPSGRGRPLGPAGTEQAHQYLAEALTLFEAIGDRREKGYTLRLWGLLSRGGDFSDATRLLLAAQQELLAGDDPVMATDISVLLAHVCIARSEVDEGLSYFQRAREGYAKLGNRYFEAGALSAISLWALRYRTVAYARETRQESLAIARAAGDMLNTAWGTWELGDIERAAGNYDLARALFEESESLLAELEDNFGVIFYERGMGALAQDLGDYGEAKRRFEDSLRLAKELSHQWAAAYAYFGLGRAELALSREEYSDRAQNHFREGLQSAYYHRYVELYCHGVMGLAACFAAAGQVEEAIRLARIVSASPWTWQEIRRQADALLDTLRASRPEISPEFDGQPEEMADIRSFVKALLGE